MRCIAHPLILMLSLFALFTCLFIGCGGEENTDSLDTDGDQEESRPDGDSDDIDSDGDSDDDGEAVEIEESKPDGLPEELPISFTRENPGADIPAEEVTAFTKKLLGFMAKVGYHDYLLRSTHGVHESTGLPPWRLWWTSNHIEKSGDTVSFVCDETTGPDFADGGHNLMTRSAKVLASAISGYLYTGDERMRQLTEGLCRGVTATMRGMVYDENDSIDHLMARNIIPLDHDYTTHDGRKKQVDYSNWRRDGDNWNCKRFNYPNNPTWGDVWITSTRSKDDVSRVMRANVYIRYAAAYAEDANVREACTETADYLQRFAQDIVDSEYHIRTKDAEGTAYIPQGDLANYITWEAMWPNAECNAKSAAALVAYGNQQGNDCGKGGVNDFEVAAMNNKYFNCMIIRNYHLSHLAQSLAAWELDEAMLLLQGLVERYERALDLPDDDLPTDRDSWERDIATSMLQAAALGYPLTEREARHIMTYLERSIDMDLQWPNWDFWDASVADGTYNPRTPDQGSDDEGQYLHWFRPEDLGEFLDYCWSPLKNPEGIGFIDCSLVKDPNGWDPAWVEETER